MHRRPVAAHDQEIHFQAWRTDALDLMPYFARALFSLRVVNTPGLGTFAVDAGYRLYIDFDAVIAKGPVFCAESLLHECTHLFGGHADAALELGVTPENHDAFNYAADCAGNDDLVAAGCVTFSESDPLPHRIGEPDGKTPHHYYAKVRSMQSAAAAQARPGPGPRGQGGGQGKGQPGQGQPFKGCGSGSGGAPAPGELGADDLGGTAPAATPGEQAAIATSVALAVREHAAKSAGRVPGGLVEIADRILGPSRTPWQQVLGALVRRSVASKVGAYDTDRSRRSRRRHRVTVRSASGGVAGRAIYPGHISPRLRIHVVRDTSGSMSADDLAVCGREITAIAARIGIRGDDLLVTDVDACAHPPKRFTGAVSIREVQGRGGTNMCVGIEAVLTARGERPHAVIVMTDGYTPWPTEAGRVPVIAVLVPQRGASEVPAAVVEKVPDFIRVVVVESADPVPAAQIG